MFSDIDNTLFICPSNMKEELIKRIKGDRLVNIKFMSLEELKGKYYFTYSDEAIYYLMSKYNYKYNVCEVLLSNLYYVFDSNLEIPKLEILRGIKKELLKEGLLKEDVLFRDSLKNVSITIYGYNYIDKYYLKMIEELKKITNVTILKEEDINYNHDTIYEFDNMDDEVCFVAEEICNLVKKGMDINNIKLYGLNLDNTFLVKKMFSFYNLPIIIDNSYLYGTRIGQDFLNNLSSNIEDTLSYIKDKYPETKEVLDIYNQIIKILNNYSWCDNYLEIKEILVEVFKKTKVNKKKLEKKIEVLNDLDNIKVEDYVFILNFVQGNIPKTSNDSLYLSDDIRTKLNLDTSYDKNKATINNLISGIKKIKNLTISYSLNGPSGVNYLSSLNDELRLNIVKGDITYSYSNLYNKLILGEKIDELIKYNNVTNNLGVLYKTYSDISYGTYNNSFKGIDKDSLEKYLNNKLLLSYSSLDNYMRCPFRYYLSSILKVNIYEESFKTKLGTIFHEVLSKMTEEDFDLDESYDKAIEALGEFSIKERFFLKKLKDELGFIIKTINKHKEYSSLDKEMYEEKINIKIDDKTTLTGIIDKFMYKETELGTLVSIVDYKTGNPNLNLNNLIYGIGMQLPMYLYLITKGDLFEKPLVIGFYLQKILHNEIVRDNVRTYDKIKEDNLKLYGYSNSDISLLKEFDSSYMDSVVIKGMKTSSKGFYAYTKLFDEDMALKITDLIDSHLNKASKDIFDAKFEIKPKRVGMENKGCEFCKFRDICYVKEQDIVNLKEYKNLEFLSDSE